MLTYEEFYANVSAVETLINDPKKSPFIDINLRGLALHEQIQYLAGLYVRHLVSYYESVQHGGSSAVVGYASLREAVAVLFFAKRTMSVIGSPAEFAISFEKPEDADDVTESLIIQQADQFARTNVLMLIGLTTLSADCADIDHISFSSWLDQQLYNLSVFCLTHRIDLQYIIKAML